jgi:hypothetical protein
MVELVEKILNGLDGIEDSLLVTSGSIVFAEGYGEELSSYSSNYSI